MFPIRRQLQDRAALAVNVIVGFAGRFVNAVRSHPVIAPKPEENVAGAITVARLFDIPSAKISGALKQFKGVEHRLEWVAEIQGVQFYNDSKATNTDATIKALEAFPSSIILILGGRDKGSDFTVLEALIQERVKTLILLGEAAEKIKRQLKTKVPQLDATSLEQATQLAFERASIGDVVLLAPACASFDMFRNYEHRGEVFKEAVRQLQEKTML